MAVLGGLGAGHETRVVSFDMESSTIAWVSEPVGAAALVHGRVGDHDFVVSAPAALAQGSPEGLAIGLDPQHLHLFDATTGRRIETETGASSSDAVPFERMASEVDTVS